MKYLMINSDDFGMTERVNAAVIRAHREGVLTSASLMVAEPGWQEAVELARQNPRLGVGLHVAVTFDRHLLPADQIPHLTGASGRFLADPLKAGWRYSRSKVAQDELRREIEAQFARFAATGLEWSHADGHQHFHMHPAVWRIFLDCCDQWGVNRVRIPEEELRLHLRDGGIRPPLLTLAGLVLRVYCRRNRRMLLERGTLGGKPVFLCDRVYGSFQSSAMNSEYVLRLLDRMGGVTNEIYFHPGTDYARRLPANEQTDGVRDVELSALLDPAVRAKIESLGLCLGRYADIEVALRT